MATRARSIFWFDLDAYYERDSSARRRMRLEERGLTVSDNQTILYDDVVVATTAHRLPAALTAGSKLS